MIKKLKKAGILFVSLFAFLININLVNAAENSQIVIEEYVQAMNNHEWYAFSTLHCTEEKINLLEFFANSNNREEHVGVLNVKKASLIELVEVDLNDVSHMLYKDYDNKDAKVYVFGVDYDVYDDSKYYSSGINYNFITLIKENENWKVSEMLPISEPQKLLDYGYKFSKHFPITINVMESRKNGYLLNYEGEIFGTIGNNQTLQSRAVINTRIVPSDLTPVRYRDANGNVSTFSFHNYCLAVLAGELRGSEFDGVVRQAQAIATKTFTWHYILYPHGATQGFDINNDQQSYRPDLISKNPKVTEDYNRVREIWMESYSGGIFIAYYKKGYYTDQTNYKNGGEFKQEGARWLYNQDTVNTTYKDLLKYYYDSSSASTGGPIRFFDSWKNEL